MSGWYKKRKVMRRYDLTSSLYDMRYAEEQAAKIEAALKNVKIERNESILDVGCGTGILFEYVADKADAVVGLDFSKKTLLQAKERIHNEDLGNVHLIEADADNMPFCSIVFDRVFAVTVLQNTPNPIDTLTEMKRIAKKDAVFVITGQKKIFTKRAFEQLLRKSQFKAVLLEDEKLLCHVAVCTKHQSVAFLQAKKTVESTRSCDLRSNRRNGGAARI
jgi:ubiquinone/menaquinone biosynthesis C-methylase UbiE